MLWWHRSLAEEIALHTGVSATRVHRIIAKDNRFGPAVIEQSAKGGRHHDYLTLEQELAFLQPIFARAERGEVATIKLLSYAHYIVSREGAGERSRLPLLISVTPDIAQEKRMQQVSQAILGSPLEVVVRTTTEELLNRHGPLDAIWLQSVPPRRKGAEPGGLCVVQQRGARSRSNLPIATESALIHKSVGA